MLKYYEPQFTEYDLVHMHNRHFVISMTIDGEKVPSFSAISLNLPSPGEDYTNHIIDNSRRSYSVSREFVDRYVRERYMLDDNTAKPAPPVKPKKTVEPKTVALPQESEPAPAKAAAPPQAAPAEAASEPVPAKSKRKRTRRRKSKSPQSAAEAQPTEMSGGGTIHLK
jgi:outer membrane biosynthesis protein TonB